MLQLITNLNMTYIFFILFFSVILILVMYFQMGQHLQACDTVSTVYHFNSNNHTMVHKM